MGFVKRSQILERFAGQPYPIVYRAFGHLRPQLGRMANASPNFPYTFSSTGDFVEGQE
jgi:4-hydroxy-3-polyprenylbenzoate decarboxylase